MKRDMTHLVENEKATFLDQSVVARLQRAEGRRGGGVIVSGGGVIVSEKNRWWRHQGMVAARVETANRAPNLPRHHVPLLRRRHDHLSLLHLHTPGADATCTVKSGWMVMWL